MTTEGGEEQPPLDGPEFEDIVDEVRIGTNVEAAVTDATTTTELKVSIPEKQEDTRKRLAIGLTAAAVLFGIGYVLAPLYADKEAWEQAQEAFQVVFTAMIGLAGSAVGFYFSTRNSDT